jgi:hypothetical protein
MRFSGSTIHRAAACPGSTALPKFGSESSAVAQRGTVIHKFLEDCINRGREEALRLCDPDFLGVCEVIDTDELPAGNAAGWRAEVAFAYNWKTGTARVVGEGLGRDYPPLEPDEIAGTADAVGIVGDKVMVYDYKTGRGHVDPAEANWQLRFLGLAAARAYGLLEASVGIIRILDDMPSFSHAHYDVFDLTAVQQQIRDVAVAALKAADDVAAGKTPHLVTGSHCTYCPTIMSCKAVTNHLVAIARNSAEFITDPVTLTPEEAGLAWVKISIVEKGLAAAKESLKQIAMSMPLPLPNGKVIAAVETGRETIDAEITEKVMTKLYGPQIAGEAVEIEYATSKDRVKKTVRAHLKENEKLGKTFDAVIDKIRDAGGVSESRFYQVKEISPKNIEVGDDANLRRELPEAADSARE